MKNRRTIVLWVAVLMSAMSFVFASKTFGSEEVWLGNLLAGEEEDVIVDDFLLEGPLGGELQGGREESTSLPIVPSTPWAVDSSLGGGLGYRENVLFGVDSKQVDSNFQQVDFDVFAMRAFGEGRGDFATVVFGELRRYDSVPGLSSEHLMALNTRVGMDFLSDYRGILQGEAMYSKQAIDASVDDVVTEALAITVFRPGVVLAAERKFDGFGKLQLSTGYRNSSYSVDSEDFVELFYGVEWERWTSDRSQLSFGWDRYTEDYDRKLSRIVGQQTTAAPLLELSGSRFEFEWLWSRRDGILRRSRFSANYESEQDRFGDYYARSKTRLRQGLEWNFGGWELDTGVSVDKLDYDVRTSSSDPSALRSDDAWRWDVELARDLIEDWRAFIRHERAFKDSSDALYEYEAASTYFGVNWNFMSR